MIIQKLLKNINNEKGSVLVISYLGMVTMIGLGAALMLLTSNEALVAERQRIKTSAFHIAEAGIESALYELRQDIVNDPTEPSWSDGDVNGQALVASTTYYDLLASTTFGEGAYTVQMKNTSDGKDAYIKSAGTIGDVTHEIEVYVRIVNLSPWANAIFGGAGASGTMINGNVDVRGSVHVLGNGLNPGDMAMDLGGTSELVGNNYKGMDSTLEGKVPALPQVVIAGETVETLNAELRVKQGVVGLSGSATVGEPNVSGNGDGEKETVDGAYVTDGYGGNKGSAHVNSDNGTTNAYDLGNAVVFPSLSDPDSADPSKTVQQAYYDGALVLTNELSNIDSSSSFTYTDGTNSISMDGSGNLSVSGKVYVDGGNDVTFNQTAGTTINYTGSGSLLVTGNANINTNLLTTGTSSFPNNILGIMTPNDIHLGGSAQIAVMGLFYAENQVTVDKQTDVVGTIVTNYFDLGSNVPSIYQVPETANNLPPGMIAVDATWYLIVSWQKI